MSEPETFARLFDTEHGQLLYYKAEHPETHQPSIHVVGAYLNDVQPSAWLGYHSDAQRDEAFGRIALRDAMATAEQLANMVRGLAG